MNYGSNENFTRGSSPWFTNVCFVEDDPEGLLENAEALVHAVVVEG